MTTFPISISTQFILLILTSYKMLGSKGILARQTLYKFLTQKGDELMLEVKNLTFQVNENGIERSIVENISFNVEDGEMLVITGPNGGGKSTLAKVLMGIDQASAGQIILDGTDISDYDINHRAEAGIGYAFQQPPRFKGMTVSKLLSLAAGEDLTRDVCCRLLSTVGLCANEYIEREVDGTLSGGEMKRLEIATVLAKPHKLCIFDEPEAGIDLWSFSMLIEQFEKMHKEKKQSLILISHQERIIQMADRIMVIEGGKIASIGQTADILPQLLGKTADSYSCLKCR